MFIRLFFLFTAVPILEIYLLISVSHRIGAAATLALVIATGIAGAYLARTQGLELVIRIREQINCGQLPAEELLDGALILAGGLLLLTPGLATDLVGFCLLIPVSRTGLKRRIRSYLADHQFPERFK